MGQNPLRTGWTSYASSLSEQFQIRILRRLYRGTKGITMASSTLRLASFSDYPSFLANRFSYIECFDDLKVMDTDQFQGLKDEKDILAALIKGETCSSSLVPQSTQESVIIETIDLSGNGVSENCLYLTKCSGVERNSVKVILAMSGKEFVKNADTILKLLSVYTYRAAKAA